MTRGRKVGTEHIRKREAVPVSVIARGAAPWQSMRLFRPRGLSGLLRFARNDEVGVDERTRGRGRKDGTERIRKREAVPVSVIARGAAPWQSARPFRPRGHSGLLRFARNDEERFVKGLSAIRNAR
jgi:hypothetical protein